MALERRGELPDHILPDDADIAIAGITASELLVGVHLADQQHHVARKATVDAILETFDVVAFDLDTARHHAALLAHARRAGRPRGAHDLLIAATASSTGRLLLTTDHNAFDDLPGVSYRLATRN